VRFALTIAGLAVLAACSEPTYQPLPDLSSDTLRDPDADSPIDGLPDTPIDTGPDTPVDTADVPFDTPLDPTDEDVAEDMPVDAVSEDVAVDDGGTVGIITSWNFATCPGGWTEATLGHTTLPNVSWECGTPHTGPSADHSGDSSLWATRLDADYRDFEWSALTSPSVDLSLFTGTLSLRFWHWYDFEYCTASNCGADNPSPCSIDGGRVEVFDGAAWVPVTPTGGYPGTLRFFDTYYTHPLKDENGYNADGTESTWLDAVVDVTAYRSSTFRVRFVFGSDSGVHEPGWYIDEVRITSP
jgi:hypothetical protein